MIITYLLHLSLVIGVYGSFQPLELNSPVSMYFLTDDVYLDYEIPQGTIANVLFCFVPTNQIVAQPNFKSDGTSTAKCSLQTESSMYYCNHLYQGFNGFALQQMDLLMDIQKISLAPTFIPFHKSAMTTSVTPPNTTSSPYFQSLTQTIKISNYFIKNRIYHMLTCPSYNPNTTSCIQTWKQNYVHTYKHPQKRVNLIVQRIHNCIVFYSEDGIITNHIFYGGVKRNGKDYLFTAVLSYLDDVNSTLNMWGGFSYASDHANRDMFCYATDGTAFDAVSLIAGPVYKDIAANIGGTNDIEIVDDFYSERFRRNYVYFIQYQRPYETSDRLGDQRIFKKIYAKFAFAAYITAVPNTEPMTQTPNCLQSKFKHNLMLAFPSDVQVFEKSLIFVWAFLLTALLF